MKTEIKIWHNVAIILMLVCVAGCVKVEPDSADTTDRDDIITLRAGIEGASKESIETRAPINNWKNTKVSFAYGSAANDYHTHWDAQIIAHGSVIFSPVRAYAPDFTPVHLKGFHPRGEVRNNNHNLVHMVIDGTQDIMVSNNLDMGTLDHKNRDPEALFKHMLSQFTFTVLNDPLSPYPPLEHITKVVVSSVNQSDKLRYEAALNLKTGTVSFSGNGGDFVVLDGNSDPIKISYGENKNIMQVMFEPGKKVKIHLEHTRSYGTPASVESVVNIVPEAGKAYEIILRYTGVGLTNTVQIIGWKNVYVGDDAGGTATIW